MSADFYITLKPQQQSVGHKWNTGIVSHLKGKEQRSSYFTWPRLITQTRYNLTDEADRHWFTRNVYKYGWQVAGVPLWHDDMAITTAVSGSLTLNVNSTLNRHIVLGREVLIVEKADPTTFFAASIAATTDTTLTLEKVLNHNYNATEYYCVPVVESRIKISPGIKTELIASTFIDMRGEEDYSQPRDYFPEWIASTMETYLGWEVVDFRFNHKKTFRYDHPTQSFQTLGPSYYETAYAGTDTHIGCDVVAELITREEIQEFWTLFDHKRGSYGRFWLPTWTRDITMNTAVDSGDVALSVELNDYDSFFLGNDVINRHILFYFPDRSWICRKIMDYSSGTLTIDTPIGVDLTAAQAEKTMISFLIFSRFESDTVMAQYQAGTVAYIGFATHGLIQEDL